MSAQTFDDQAEDHAFNDRQETLRRQTEPAGPDHTSGVMRCRYEVIGGHVHCAIFGPYSGKAGDLTFRVGDEWRHFLRTHPNWSFADRAVSEGTPNP